MVTLTEFTEEQTAAAKVFLERVFVNLEQAIVPDPAMLELIVAMIMESDDKIARLITQSLATPALIYMAPALVEARQMAWLDWVDRSILPGMFSGLRVPLQRTILEALYTESPDMYDLLRQHSSGQMIRVGATFVSKAKATVMRDTRVDRLVAQIMDDTESPANIEAAAGVLRRDFDWDDVVDIVATVVKEMDRLSVPLVSSSDFKKHLKLHWMFAALPRTFSDADRAPWDRIVADAMYRMPDTQWVLKVLNQFPVETIVPVILLIRLDQHHSDLSARNRAARLSNELATAIDMPDFENVRLALDSIPPPEKE